MLSHKPWRLDRVIWLLAAMLASLGLGMIVVQGYNWAFAADDGKVAPQVPVMMLGTLVTHGLCLFLVAIFLREHHITWNQAFGFSESRLARTLGLALITALLVFFLSQGLYWLSETILKRLSQPVVLQPTVQALQQPTPVSQVIYFAFMIVIAAPIVEEIIYRGIIYPSIKQEGFPKLAIWGTSLLFAWSHVNMVTFLPLFFMGAILILLYETTDNLLAPIVTHSLFNATNYYFLVSRP
jgi:membrane protease YdiL (CAAX protease family)